MQKNSCPLELGMMLLALTNEMWASVECTTLDRDFEIQGAIHQISILWPWSSQELALKGSSHVPGYHDQSSPDASPVQLFVMLWTVALQAPLSMEFFRQEYWSGLPCPLPGDLPNPGIEPTSLMSRALAGKFFTISATYKAHSILWPFPIEVHWFCPPQPTKKCIKIKNLRMTRLWFLKWWY